MLNITIIWMRASKSLYEINDFVTRWSVALLVIHFWMKSDHPKFIFLSAFDAIVFRSELVLLFGLLLLMELYSRRLSILKYKFLNTFAFYLCCRFCTKCMTFCRCIMYSVLSGAVCLVWTITMDTIFWRRTLWPEGEVLWYNTIENKSHNWGVK